MKSQLLQISLLSLIFLTAPLEGQAETGWTIYKPGVVKSAIARGETVVLGYLSSW